MNSEEISFTSAFSFGEKCKAFHMSQRWLSGAAFRTYQGAKERNKCDKLQELEEATVPELHSSQ